MTQPTNKESIICIDGTYYKRLDRPFEQWHLLPHEERKKRMREYMRAYRARSKRKPIKH